MRAKYTIKYMSKHSLIFVDAILIQIFDDHMLKGSNKYFFLKKIFDMIES